MITLDEIELLAKKYFDYLVTDFGFSKTNSETVPFMHVIKYANENFIVEVRYGFRNEYLEVKICSKKRFLNDGSYKSVLLHHILMRKKADFNYEIEYLEQMPKKIGLEESFRKISTLFKEFGANILLDKEWFSWEEVMGRERPGKDVEIKTTIEINYKKKDTER